MFLIQIFLSIFFFKDFLISVYYLFLKHELNFSLDVVLDPARSQPSICLQDKKVLLMEKPVLPT